MKKITLLVLAFLLVLSLFSCQNQSNDNPETTAPDNENAIPEANPASDFEYELTEDGKEIYIKRYIGTSEHVVIPSTIENIPVTVLNTVDYLNTETEGTFEKTAVKSVVLPTSIRVIGRKAFRDCDKLVEVKIPKKSDLISLSYESFENCTSLKNIDFSSTGLINISENAFSNCTNLKSILLPDSVTKIAQAVFYGCSSLLEIDLPNELTELGKDAIANCTSLKKISIPTKVNLLVGAWGVPIHDNPALEQVIIEEGRQNLNGYAFIDTTSNVEIVIPKSVTMISIETFFIHGDAKIKFLGDCPEHQTEKYFTGNPTIYYDPSTSGWENCSWKNHHTLEPIK